ncbi:hypothetical protein [uncultured Methanoregula sp.]|uniref:hypothetical protein n=1 Tax=uncultured Methanoregula sp. TaxID=1005933 RepID=UPI00374A0CDF
MLFVILPVSADVVPDRITMKNATAPQVVQIGVHVMDFHRFNLADGTFETNFYLNLESDSPVSINDLEIMNGHATSVDTIIDNPNEKSYRIFAVIDVDPDLRRYPFDRHTLPIEIEPKLKDESRMVLVILENNTYIEPDMVIPGWQMTSVHSSIISKSYASNEFPYSRAVFRYSIQRETASIVVKFFLPVGLLLIVTFSSLLMKGAIRLVLNASMLVVAVFIHWRTSDAIPLVAFATFLDVFMVITYLTIVMVLVSGILIQKFTESNNTARVEQIHYWSLWGIPSISISLYFLLFLSLLL